MRKWNREELSQSQLKWRREEAASPQLVEWTVSKWKEWGLCHRESLPHPCLGLFICSVKQSTSGLNSSCVRVFVNALRSDRTEGTDFLGTADRKASGLEVELQDRQEHVRVRRASNNGEQKQSGRAYTSQSGAEMSLHARCTFTTLSFWLIYSSISSP